MGDPEVIRALREGRAFADLSDRHKVLVTGGDARAWLNDLLTAEVASLAPGATLAALLLSPTGRIRAAVTVAAVEEGLLLVQDPRQPAVIDALLQPYVLSSEVELRDLSQEMALFALPGGEPPARAGGRTLRPSSLGPGTDLLVPATAAAALRASLAGRPEAGPGDLEAWRIGRGVARFPVDLTIDSLPNEADFSAAIRDDTGCYLGQEAVARVRNLGHPPWLVLSVRAEGAASAGEAVVAAGEEAGTVTSAAAEGRATAALARVRWSARGRPLATASGTPLAPAGVAAGGV